MVSTASLLPEDDFEAGSVLVAAAAPAEPKKKAKKTSPTQRSLAEMRKRGYRCAVVEKWNPHAKVLQDLFGIIDILCVGNGETVGVQCTTSDNLASRITKMGDSDAIGDLRKAGWKLLAQGWRKNADGKWTLREVDVS